MTDAARPDPEETERLLERVRAGDRAALDELLARHRGYVRRMVELRLDRRLGARVDASDVVQEAQLEVAQRIDDFLQRNPMPFHVWLRKTACERILRLRRRHVGAGNRSLDREVALPEGSSVMLAQQLLGPEAPPSRHAAARETAALLGQALARLADDDREIVLLRSFEGLSNQEAAQVLGVEGAAASKRYGRALLRLRKILKDDGLTESRA